MPPEESPEICEAIRRHEDVRFSSRTAGFLDEHQANYAERWDLHRLFLACRESVSLHVVGNEGNPFEPNQVVKSGERLGGQGLDIRVLPGGHSTRARSYDV